MPRSLSLHSQAFRHKASRILTGFGIASVCLVMALAGCRGKADNSAQSTKQNDEAKWEEQETVAKKATIVVASKTDEHSDRSPNGKIEIPSKIEIPTNPKKVEEPDRTVEPIDWDGPRVLQDTMHLRHEIRHRGPIDLHPDFGKFSENQLRKDHTLVVLAFDSEYRQNYFGNRFMYLMDEDQRLKLMQVVQRFDGRYRRLLRQRNEILQVASDKLDVETLLLNNKVETLNLSRLVRSAIRREVLDKEQLARFQDDIDKQRKRREDALKKKQEPIE